MDVSHTKNAVAFFKDYNDPSLKNLAKLLRDPSMWPRDFVWDYRGISTCAVGLGQRYWGIRKVGEFQRALGLTNKQFNNLFCNFGQHGVFKFIGSLFKPSIIADITPIVIADRIDRMLARQ